MEFDYQISVGPIVYPVSHFYSICNCCQEMNDDIQQQQYEEMLMMNGQNAGRGGGGGRGRGTPSRGGMPPRGGASSLLPSPHGRGGAGGGRGAPPPRGGSAPRFVFVPTVSFCHLLQLFQRTFLVDLASSLSESRILYTASKIYVYYCEAL